MKSFQRDAEDAEYDKGRVKKIRKRVPQPRPDFQKIYEAWSGPN